MKQLNSAVYCHESCDPALFCDVLGILLCAKTKLAKTRLAAYFANGTSVVGVNRLRKINSLSVNLELSYFACAYIWLHLH